MRLLLIVAIAGTLACTACDRSKREADPDEARKAKPTAAKRETGAKEAAKQSVEPALEDLFAQDAEGLKGYKELEEKFQKRRYQEVIDGFEEMIGSSPRAPWVDHAEIMIAESEIKLKKYDAGIDRLERLIRDRPESAKIDDAEYELANAHYERAWTQENRQGLNEEVLAGYGNALTRFTAIYNSGGSDEESLARALHMSGQVQDKMGDRKAATASLRKVADEYGETKYATNALYKLGGNAIEDGDAQAAIRTFREIVNEYPDDRMAKRAKKKLQELSLVGRKAPELQISEWLGSEPIELKQYLGKVVLLEFWTTWCPHCRKQVPHMKELYKKYGDKGLVLITVSRNDKGQTTEKMKQFMEENEIPYPVGIDDNRKTTKDYISGSIPAAALIDQKGVIRWRSHPGYLKDALIEALLTEK